MAAQRRRKQNGQIQGESHSTDNSRRAGCHYVHSFINAPLYGGGFVQQIALIVGLIQAICALDSWQSRHRLMHTKRSFNALLVVREHFYRINNIYHRF